MLILWLLQSNKLEKTLVLVSGYSAVTTTLESEIDIKMLEQMFLESLISDESHPANSAVVFDAFVYLSLDKQIESNEGLEREGHLLLW